MAAVSAAKKPSSFNGHCPLFRKWAAVGRRPCKAAAAGKEMKWTGAIRRAARRLFQLSKKEEAREAAVCRDAAAGLQRKKRPREAAVTKEEWTQLMDVIQVGVNVAGSREKKASALVHGPDRRPRPVSVRVYKFMRVRIAFQKLKLRSFNFSF